jgi:arginyl-tRNA synthetase
MTTSTQELSKNELKKLQKKAEKAAKKEAAGAANKGQAGAPPPDDAAAAAVPPPPPAPESSSSSNKKGIEVTAGASQKNWTMIQAQAGGDRSTIVTVWAAAQWGGCDLPTAATTTSVLLRKHGKSVASVALIGGGGSATDPPSSSLAPAVVISEAGNAMALALMPAPHNYTDSILMDEWCEWERSVLRPSALEAAAARNMVGSPSTAAMQTCFDALEGALQKQPTPVHLVGNALTVADICVATTLLLLLAPPSSSSSSAMDESTIPMNVRLFLQAHRAAFDSAVAQAEALASASTSKSATAAVDMNEPSLLKVVDAVFRHIIADLFGPDIDLPPFIVKYCSNIKHGDVQLSAAMPIFAALKKTGRTSEYANPTAVAQAIVDSIEPDHPVLSDLQAQGSGFVVCKFANSYLQHRVNLFLQTQKLPIPMSDTPQVCVVDFSSPNIAKEMHVGHLRSTIIGEAVCRILEAANYKVHRVNHVGDWGTQFGMLIQYLREEYPDVASATGEEAELPNITDLTVFYKNAKQRFDESSDFKKQSQTNVVDLQAGNPECLKIWKMLCDVSRREFEKVYTRLDVTCEEYGESYYNARIPPVIEEFVQAGKISVEEGGAKCVFVDKYKVPLMLQKSDGGYGYDSTDMAALKYRLAELRADRIIVITDFSQGDHFKMVYAAGRDIGWVDQGQRLEHIGFGTVQGEDGKRFKTRSGDTVRLVDLLDEAVMRMEGELRARMVDGKVSITEGEVHEVAEAIGYGAVKYFDLRRNPTSNYKFSYDAMLDTKGDTAVYLLYARVRLESIVAKAAAEFNVDVVDLLQRGATVSIAHPSERNLAVHLHQFADVMAATLEDLYPCHICEYVYKLATAASDFVTQCRVLGSEEMQSRVLLCHATAAAMHQCFDLLGIRNVKRI